jgi:hypothetical protein
MKILRLKGNDKELYELVAPLVMNASILKLNNNYPFKTAPDYIWHVLIDNKNVAGFIPLKPISNGYNIDNYYFRLDNKDVIKALLQDIIDSKDYPELVAIVHKRNTEAFIEMGFARIIEWKKYDKMIYQNPKSNDQTTECL